VLVVLPTLYVLGLFTFVRLVTSSTEDLLYGRAINRIRNYYEQVAGDEARYLLLGGHDDTLGVLVNMGIARPSRWQLYFTLASMVAVLSAVVGGSAVAFLAGLTGATLALAAGIGAVTAAVSCSLQFRWQRRAHIDARRRGEVLFPSPTSPEQR
jgi:small-conductance mechanosensitive channel